MKRHLCCMLACLCLGISTLAAGADDDLARNREFALRGDPVAQFFLGLRYYDGLRGVTKDRSEAARWWRKSAEQAFPDAEMAIGDLYYLGDGVSQDYDEAYKWFRRAALHGNSMSCLRLSTMYMKSQGVSLDLVQAYSWLSVYRPGEEATRTKQRHFLSILEAKLSSSQLQRARTAADELREEIRSNSK
jgi:hypothetical protein